MSRMIHTPILTAALASILLLTPAAFAQHKPAAPKPTPTPKATPTPKPTPPAPITTLDDALTALKSTNAVDQRRALAGLGHDQIPLDEKRKPEVSKILADFLPTASGNTDLTLAALVRWATADAAPTLLKWYTDHKDSSPERCFSALAATHDEKAAAVIVEATLAKTDGFGLKDYIRECGPAAEPALLARLEKETDENVRLRCIFYLGDVGTEKSIAVLEKMPDADKPDLNTGFVLRKIRDRVNPEVAVVGYLADLQSGDAKRVGEAARHLHKIAPLAKQQSAVTTALIKDLDVGGKGLDRASVLLALAKWATADDVKPLTPRLADLAQEPDDLTRSYALACLAVAKTPEALTAALASLDKQKPTLYYPQALIAFAPDIEAPLIERLPTAKGPKLGAITETLARVGTSKSLDALNEFAKTTTNSDYKHLAQGAATSISKRLGTTPN